MHSGLEITNFPAITSALTPSSPNLHLPNLSRNPFLYLQDGRLLMRWWGARYVRSEGGQPSYSLSFDSWDTVTWRQSHREYSPDRPGDFLGDFPLGILCPLTVPGFIALNVQSGIIVLNVNQTNLGPRTIENPRPGKVIGGFAASPDGSTAAIANQDGYVTILDWKTLKVIRSFKGFLLGAESVAYSPDGRRLAVGSTGNEAVKLWDTDSWEELLTLRDEGSIFESLQFSPDGRLIVAANKAGRVCAWKTPTAREIAAFGAKATADVKRP